MKHQPPQQPGDATLDSEEPARARNAIDRPPLVSALDERRFAVGDERARGGIGRILVARDVMLGREVAIKQLLSPDGPEAMARFMREAMITARLQHPSIVPVYDAGVRGSGEPYYAMPLVPGGNLLQAISGAATLTERLALLPHLQAVADALAYAHGQGIVHRDLKPSNVLVGPFGETVVIDWGLAKDLRNENEVTPALGDIGLRLDVTQTGVARGTPAYMSPEQARGEPVGPESDVYSLGGMLYHLLTGRAPHGERHPVLMGPPPSLESIEPRAPGDLVAIVEKAMAREPGQRYSDAKHFALDLRRFATGQMVGARRYRPWTRLRRFVARHRITAAAAVLVAAATAALAVPYARHMSTPPACAGDEELVAAVWNPAQAKTISARLTELAGQDSVDPWRRAEPVFTAYANRWATLRHEACVNFRIKKIESDSVFDRRMYCYERRLSQLKMTLASLAGLSSRSVALRVDAMATNLPSLDDCSGKVLSFGEVKPPPVEDRPAINQAWTELNAIKAMSREGRYQEALDALKLLEPRVRKLDFLSLKNDVVYAIADNAALVGDIALAKQAFTENAVLAAQMGRANQVFMAEVTLMSIDADEKNFERALARANLLEAVAYLSKDPDLLPMHHEALGIVHEGQERWDDALAEYRKAIDLLPVESPREAPARSGYAGALIRLGRYDEAVPELEKVLVLRQKRRGSEHPDIARALGDLGDLARRRGRHGEALDYFRRALAVQTAMAKGKDTIEVARAVDRVAMAEDAAGEFDTALASHARADGLRRKLLGDKHAEVGEGLRHRAMTLAHMDRFADAESAARQALDIAEGALEGQLTLGEVLLSRGEASQGREADSAHAAALVALDQAVALAGAAGDAAREPLVRALTLRARVLHALGRRPAARADASRAITLLAELPEAERAVRLDAHVTQAELLLADGQAGPAVELLAKQPGGDNPLVDGRATLVRLRARAGDEAVTQKALAALDGSSDARARRLAAVLRAAASKPTK